MRDEIFDYMRAYRITWVNGGNHAITTIEASDIVEAIMVLSKNNTPTDIISAVLLDGINYN